MEFPRKKDKDSNENGYKIMFQPFRALWHGYEYLYFRLYASNLRLAGESDLPQWNAMFGVAFMSFLNLMTIALSVSAWTGFNPAFRAAKYQVVAAMIVWAILNYYAFVRNDKYKKIAEKFTRERSDKRRRNIWFCWLYVVLSFAAAIFSALYIM